jgi:hypothetical protein
MENLTFVTPTIVSAVSNMDTSGVNFISNLPYQPRGDLLISFGNEVVRYVPMNDAVFWGMILIFIAVIVGFIVGFSMAVIR